MSGAEPFAVLGAISSVITIVETIKEIYDGARDLQGLHETFRKISEHLQVILSTLRQVERMQKQAEQDHKESTDAAQKEIIEEASRAVEPIISRCKNNAQTLSTFLASSTSDQKASQVRRYANAVRNAMPRRKSKVQRILQETLEVLDGIHRLESFRNITTTREIQSAIRELSGRLSLPDVRQHSDTRNANIRLTVQTSRPGSRSRYTYNEWQAPDTGSVFMNAGSKIMNQGAVQHFHGPQNITL